MAHIALPSAYTGTVWDIGRLLEDVTRWHVNQGVSGADAHRRVWYRGHGDSSYLLQPGVYRPEFSKCAKAMYGKNAEDKRLNLEREMLSEFRTSGATLLDPNAIVQIYFMAQHYGMPTRLLDWTTNPLTALFFAVKDCDADKDGALYVMDANKLLPTDVDVPKGIVTMRHPYVTDAIGMSFWRAPLKGYRRALVLPVRPDNQAGRIGQQSSCFTLHMHLAEPCVNPTLARLKVDKKSKANILAELRRLNINEFSIYNDLDHLAREIRITRGFKT